MMNMLDKHVYDALYTLNICFNMWSPTRRRQRSPRICSAPPDVFLRSRPFPGTQCILCSADPFTKGCLPCHVPRRFALASAAQLG